MIPKCIIYSAVLDSIGPRSVDDRQQEGALCMIQSCSYLTLSSVWKGLRSLKRLNGTSCVLGLPIDYELCSQLLIHAESAKVPQMKPNDRNQRACCMLIQPLETERSL